LATHKWSEASWIAPGIAFKGMLGSAKTICGIDDGAQKAFPIAEAVP
jgi:hypothetical protein